LESPRDFPFDTSSASAATTGAKRHQAQGRRAQAAVLLHETRRRRRHGSRQDGLSAADERLFHEIELIVTIGTDSRNSTAARATTARRDPHRAACS
jgi:hypothetical protein